MRLRHLYFPARIAFIAMVRLRTSGQRLCMIRATRPMSRADNRADEDITTRGSGMPRFENRSSAATGRGRQSGTAATGFGGYRAGDRQGNQSDQGKGEYVNDQVALPSRTLGRRATGLPNPTLLFSITYKNKRRNSVTSCRQLTAQVGILSVLVPPLIPHLVQQLSRVVMCPNGTNI